MATKYDMQSTVAEIKRRLEKLKAEQQPGERVGLATKTEILHAMIDDLRELVNAGYTPAQIAQAMKISDDFSILPKSITQALNSSSGRKAATRRASTRKRKDSGDSGEQATKPQNATQSSASNTQKTAATFTVTPDSEDL